MKKETIHDFEDTQSSRNWNENISENESESEHSTFEEVQTEEEHIEPKNKRKMIQTSGEGSGNAKKAVIGVLALAGLSTAGYFGYEMLMAEDEAPEETVVEQQVEEPKPTKQIKKEETPKQETQVSQSTEDVFNLDKGKDKTIEETFELPKTTQETESVEQAIHNDNQNDFATNNAFETKQPVYQQVEEPQPQLPIKVEEQTQIMHEPQVQSQSMSEDVREELNKIEEKVESIDKEFKTSISTLEEGFLKFANVSSKAIGDLHQRVTILEKEKGGDDKLKEEVEMLKEKIKILEEKIEKQPLSCGVCPTKDEKEVAKEENAKEKAKEIKVVSDEATSKDVEQVKKVVTKKKTERTGNYIELVGKRKPQVLESKMPKQQAESKEVVKNTSEATFGGETKIRSILNDIAWVETNGKTHIYKVGDKFNGREIGKIDANNGIFDTQGLKLLDVK